MSNRLPALLAGVALAGLALPGTAPALAGDKTAERPAATATAKTAAPDGDAIKRIDGVEWHSTLDGARGKAAAEQGKRKARPVLWLRMLGDLAGKT